MNNNITEDHVSFEVAQLLQEKGFDIKVTSNYNQIKEILGDVSGDIDWVIKRPTHSLAIKWIKENFGIHIYIKVKSAYVEGDIVGYMPIISFVKMDKNEINLFTDDPFKTTLRKWVVSVPKSDDEAAEAALLYTLKHLV